MQSRRIIVKTNGSAYEGVFDFPDSIDECREMFGDRKVVEMVCAKHRLNVQQRLRNGNKPKTRFTRKEIAERLRNKLSKDELDALLT